MKLGYGRSPDVRAVTAALVNRNFDTKEALFRQAIGTQDPSPVAFADLDRERFGNTPAARVLPHGGETPSAKSFDPIHMLLLSASSTAAQPVLRDYVENTVMPPLVAYFGGEQEAGVRAALVLSVALGAIVLGQILTTAPHADDAPEAQVAALLSAMFQAAADAPLARA